MRQGLTLSRQVEPEQLDHLAADDPRAIHSRRDLRWINSVMAQPGKANYVTLEDKMAAATPVFQKLFPGKTLDELRKVPVEEFYNNSAKTEEIFGVSSGTYAAIDGNVTQRATDRAQHDPARPVRQHVRTARAARSPAWPRAAPR